MNKTLILFVTGDDYTAMDFEKMHKPQEYYEQMVREGVKEKVIEDVDEYSKARIIEFDSIDPRFFEFVREHLHDYDASKTTNFYVLHPVT